MSRTTHHREYYKRHPEADWMYGKEYVDATYTYVDWRTKEQVTNKGSCLMDIAGAKTKKKKRGFHPKHWASATPSWWIREYMTVPKRAACSIWEKEAVKYLDIEEIPVCPDYGRKPHFFYW